MAHHFLDHFFYWREFDVLDKLDKDKIKNVFVGRG